MIRTQCPECESSLLSWGMSPEVIGGFSDGQLYASEVQTLFILGCDECSATVQTLRPEEVTTLLSAVTPPVSRRNIEGISRTLNPQAWQTTAFLNETHREEYRKRLVDKASEALSDVGIRVEAHG